MFSVPCMSQCQETTSEYTEFSRGLWSSRWRLWGPAQSVHTHNVWPSSQWVVERNKYNLTAGYHLPAEPDTARTTLNISPSTKRQQSPVRGHSRVPFSTMALMRGRVGRSEACWFQKLKDVDLCEYLNMQSTKHFTRIWGLWASKINSRVF